MKILIVGLGSMGKRRARLIRLAFADCELAGVDAQQSRRADAQDERLVDCAYESIEAAVSDFAPLAAFVCTSPLSHHGIIGELLERGLHVFTELNLVSDGYDELTSLAAKSCLTLFLSSTLLYRRDLQYVIGQTRGKRVNYVYHCGQYLPDWHPWESFKDFFVGDPRTNGCRELLAIDLPWLLCAMGEVESFSVMSDRMTALDISYKDNYIITLSHKSGARGVLLADVVSRVATRSLEVFSEDIHISWLGTPDSLRCFDPATGKSEYIRTYDAVDSDSRYSDNIIENAYADEIATFFGVIDGAQTARYTFDDDLKTLALIDRIEGYSR